MKDRGEDSSTYKDDSRNSTVTRATMTGSMKTQLNKRD